MRRSTLALLTAALLALTLSACTTPPLQRQPTIVDTPAILWDVAPTSPLEDNKYVQALRAADIGAAMAINLHDFSILQFANTRDARQGVEGYENYLNAVFGNFRQEKFEPYVILGPARWVPLSVTPNAGGNGAFVSACFIGTPIESAEGLRGVGEEGRLATFEVTTDLESGLLVTAAMSSGSTTACDASEAPVGRFSPVPTLLDPETGTQVEFTTTDVIAPPWWEDRCFTGWSKNGCNRGEDAR